MKKLLVATSLIISGFTATAAPVDISLWTQENSPNYSRSATWNVGSGNNAVQNTNSNGSLVSDFVESGDFSFFGTMTATLDSFNDNDIMGLVFGWQDDANHYRLGWEQGGYNDSATNASGMWLVREVGGVSTVLFETEQFWDDLVEYDFVVGRSGNDISFELDGVSQTFTDTSFMSGRVGFYTESQTANFSGLTSVPKPPEELENVPAPAPLALLALGLGTIALRRKA